MSLMAVHRAVSKGPAGQTQPWEAFSDELHLSSLGHQTDPGSPYGRAHKEPGHTGSARGLRENQRFRVSEWFTPKVTQQASDSLK